MNDAEVVVFSFSELMKLLFESYLSFTQSLSEVVWLISASEDSAFLESVSEMKLLNITGLKKV